MQYLIFYEDDTITGTPAFGGTETAAAIGGSTAIVLLVVAAIIKCCFTKWNNRSGNFSQL